MKDMMDVSREPFESHYVIQKELGRGKFATVYQCEKRNTKELFAAKIIQTKSQKNMEESLNEVEILKSVDHVGIVKCYDVFQSRSSLTMILELVGGGELFEKLANEDHVSEGQAATYTKQVLEALAHLHSLKIAHLDLKPENLMLSAVDSDVIKIVDFGLSKRLNKRVVCMQGTAEFVPPEVISLDPLGAYSDMWSIGVIVYIMVSGYSPFMGDDDNQTYGNISMCDYEFYEEEFANISEDCKDFIKNMLLTKTTDRLTANGAINHNWIVNRSQNMNTIEAQKLKRFLAQRKWRALHKTIQSTRIFNSLLGAKKRQITPPSVNMDHRKLMVAEGDSISITAHVVSVKPTCSWSKDGTALIVDKQKISVIQSDTQSILVVSQFSSQDEGNYTIACTNPAGTSTATIQLITLAPTAPCVSFNNREYTGYEGENVQLEADLVSDPKPTVVWENKGKRDVAKKSRFTAVEDKCYAKLNITKLKLADAGNYTLKARNKLGRGAASVQLKVLPRRITELDSASADQSPKEQKSGIGSKTQPQSTDQLKPKMEPGKVKSEPAKLKAKTEPVKPKADPVKPKPEPVKPKAEPPKPKTEPVKPKAEPVKPKAEPVKPKAEPVKPKAEPVKPKAEPAKPKPEPEKTTVEPVNPKPEPVKPKAEPVKPKAEPVKPKAEPVKPKAEPVKPKAEPVKPKAEPVKPKAEPVKPTAEPAKPKAEPVKPKAETIKPKDEPIKPQVEAPKPAAEPVKPPAKSAAPVSTAEETKPTPKAETPSKPAPSINHNSDILNKKIKPAMIDMGIGKPKAESDKAKSKKKSDAVTNGPSSNNTTDSPETSTKKGKQLEHSHSLDESTNELPSLSSQADHRTRSTSLAAVVVAKGLSTKKRDCKVM